MNMATPNGCPLIWDIVLDVLQGKSQELYERLSAGSFPIWWIFFARKASPFFFFRGAERKVQGKRFPCTLWPVQKKLLRIVLQRPQPSSFDLAIPRKMVRWLHSFSFIPSDLYFLHFSIFFGVPCAFLAFFVPLDWSYDSFPLTYLICIPAPWFQFRFVITLAVLCVAVAFGPARFQQRSSRYVIRCKSCKIFFFLHSRFTFFCFYVSVCICIVYLTGSSSPCQM